MLLIDRYVYAVTKQLPADIREDIGKELYNNIEDMLPADAKEEEVQQVLEKLGDPRKLAEDYYPCKRYLIGPALYDQYVSVLKLVLGICIVSFVGITVVDWAVNWTDQNFLTDNLIKLIVNMIGTIINGAMQAALWVTFIFAVLERSRAYEGNQPFSKKQWSLDELPELPNNNRMISRRESVFSIFFTILFTSILYFKPQLIAMYIKEDNGSFSKIPFFDIDRLNGYIILILLLTVIHLGILIWKFVVGSYNIPLAIGNLLSNAVLCIVMIVMVSDHLLVNKLFLSRFKEILNISTSVNMSVWWHSSSIIFIIVFISVCIWDSVSGFLKCRNREIIK